MQPAFSVILLTTLIGTGQGLFLALFTGQVYSVLHVLPEQDSRGFYALGSLLALGLLCGGLAASFFHLGHKERGWRAMARWRTSWLSREVILLPVFMGLVCLYGGAHYLGFTQPIVRLWNTVDIDTTYILGLLATAAAFALYYCTGMIYASVRFFIQWATPLTVINYTLLGSASGFALATAFSSLVGSQLLSFYALWTILITVAAFLSRGLTLVRNLRLTMPTTTSAAIGVRHAGLKQKSMGFMGGSFNTREFSHGCSPARMEQIQTFFLVTTFLVPVIAMSLLPMEFGHLMFLGVFAVQFLGLLAERWFFFAQADHPQNLYYRQVG
ncbi:MAG: dimethyl sulfoxide reductase anchor subunit [Magnetococcus sp. WYHC-3]